MTTAQNVMLSFMPNMTTPPDAGFLIRHFRLFFLIPWVLSVLMLISAIGLLRRMEWARKTFIALLSFGVLWSAASLLFIYFAGFDAPAIPGGAANEYRETVQQFDSFRIGMQIFTTIFALLISGLFIWIIRNLTTPAVSDEFAT